MTKSIGFFKTAILGGVIFLVPFVVILLILAKAFELMKALASPFTGLLPADMVGGILLVNLMAAASVVVLCFLAGLVAKSIFAGRIVTFIENSFLSKLPIYPIIKGMTGSIPGNADFDDLKTVLVRLDEFWQAAFEIERLADSRVVIFLPGAPNPWSGTVCIMPADRVEPLNASLMDVSQNLRRFGRQTDKLLIPS